MSFPVVFPLFETRVLQKKGKVVDRDPLRPGCDNNKECGSGISGRYICL